MYLFDMVLLAEISHSFVSEFSAVVIVENGWEAHHPQQVDKSCGHFFTLLPEQGEQSGVLTEMVDDVKHTFVWKDAFER